MATGFERHWNHVAIGIDVLADITAFTFGRQGRQRISVFDLGLFADTGTSTSSLIPMSIVFANVVGFVANNSSVSSGQIDCVFNVMHGRGGEDGGRREGARQARPIEGPDVAPGQQSTQVGCESLAAASRPRSSVMMISLSKPPAIWTAATPSAITLGS